MEGYIPEFNFIFIVAAVTEGAFFHGKRAFFQHIFDIQIFQRGKLPVGGDSVFLQRVEDVGDRLGKTVDNACVFYNGSRSQRSRRGAERYENIRDDLKRSGGQIAEKAGFHVVAYQLFYPSVLYHKVPVKFTFNQWFCIIDADILSIMVILIIP